MTPSLKELALADHPFDEIAVEAAMASLLTNVHRASWTKDRMSAALTAACNSMSGRGKEIVARPLIFVEGCNHDYP